MKKRFPLSLRKSVLLSASFFFALLFTNIQAQTETDTSFSAQMNYVFANVDKSKVPYGILKDYAMEFTNLAQFNGAAVLADSNATNMGTLYEVYYTLLTGRIHSSASGFIKADSISSRWANYRQPGRITLAGLFFQYARFKDNAANNYITVSGGRLYDKYVSGVWQNPYQLEKTFVISPSVLQYDSLSFSILLPANLWLTNSGGSVSNININVNDGLGYRTLTPGTALNVSYTTTGNKEWTYRLKLTDGTYLYAHSKVWIGPYNPGT